LAQAYRTMGKGLFLVVLALVAGEPDEATRLRAELKAANRLLNAKISEADAAKDIEKKAVDAEKMFEARDAKIELKDATLTARDNNITNLYAVLQRNQKTVVEKLEKNIAKEENWKLEVSKNETREVASEHALLEQEEKEEHSERTTFADRLSKIHAILEDGVDMESQNASAPAFLGGNKPLSLAVNPTNATVEDMIDPAVVEDSRSAAKAYKQLNWAFKQLHHDKDQIANLTSQAELAEARVVALEHERDTAVSSRKDLAENLEGVESNLTKANTAVDVAATDKVEALRAARELSDTTLAVANAALIHAHDVINKAYIASTK